MGYGIVLIHIHTLPCYGLDYRFRNAKKGVLPCYEFKLLR